MASANRLTDNAVVPLITPFRESPALSRCRPCSSIIAVRGRKHGIKLRTRAKPQDTFFYNNPTLTQSRRRRPCPSIPRRKNRSRCPFPPALNPNPTQKGIWVRPKRVYGLNPKRYILQGPKGIPLWVQRIYPLRLRGYTLRYRLLPYPRIPRTATAFPHRHGPSDIGRGPAAGSPRYRSRPR